ncbi:MAG: TIGR02300 family protein [Pseudomonadota bacterium]
MAKEGAGTKRVCPETGRKFYDLDKDPIVSPYTGKEYPLSFFDESVSSAKPKEKEAAEDKENEDTDLENDVADDAGPEIISLEDADDDDDDTVDGDDDVPDDIPDVEIDDDDDDDKADGPFLDDEDDDDDNLSDIIPMGSDDKDDS